MTEQPNSPQDDLGATNESQTGPGQTSAGQTSAGPPPYRQPAPPPPYKRLTRSTWDAPVSGVCGGIANYLGVDPTLVRVLAVIAMVFTFPVGPIVYAILWAVIPKE